VRERLYQVGYHVCVWYPELEVLTVVGIAVTKSSYRTAGTGRIYNSDGPSRSSASPRPMASTSLNLCNLFDIAIFSKLGAPRTTYGRT
jgi:hypothetical protein